MRALTLAFLALAAPPALAQEEAVAPPVAPEEAAAAPAGEPGQAALAPPPTAAPVVPAAKVAPPESGAHRFGLLVEGGVPEGLAVALSFRPVSGVRLWAGPAWNYVAYGVHGGIALVPYSSGLAPALSIEAGRFFDADLTRFTTDGGAPSETEPLLRNVSYDYLAAHLGLEIGSRGFAFTVRAGVAWIRATAKGSTEGTSTGSDYWLANPRVTAAVPSVKLGFQTTF